LPLVEGFLMRGYLQKFAAVVAVASSFTLVLMIALG